MAIRTGTGNPALGLPNFMLTHTLPASVPLGTITEGYDDVTSTNAEYIFLQSPANIVAGDDVTYDPTTYVATEVGAGVGQADAIIASGAGVGAWFKLKPRRVGP